MRFVYIVGGGYSLGVTVTVTSVGRAFKDTIQDTRTAREMLVS